MSIQTILGANGVIGRELSRHLPAHTDGIRQVNVTDSARGSSSSPV